MILRGSLLSALAVTIISMTDATAQFAPAVRSPCYDEVTPLREEVQKQIAAAVAASRRKPPAEAPEMCELIGRYAEAEAKLLKFIEDIAPRCGLSPQSVQQMKAGQAKTAQAHKRTCAAMNPPVSAPKIWTPVTPPPIWMGPPARPPKRMRIAAFPPDFEG
jgi:hypothetical protein